MKRIYWVLVVLLASVQGYASDYKHCYPEKRLLTTCYEYNDVLIEDVERYYELGEQVQKIGYSLPYVEVKQYELQRFDLWGRPLPVQLQTERNQGVKSFAISSQQGTEQELFAQVLRYLRTSPLAFKCKEGEL